MGWRNWLEKEVEVVLTVLNEAAEATYSVQAFDWSGGKGRPKEGDTVLLVNALIRRRPFLRMKILFCTAAAAKVSVKAVLGSRIPCLLRTG